MYGMTPWKDEVVQYPYRYKETQNADGTVEHEPSPGTVMQEGTPQSATNFNHMENGISNATEVAALMALSAVHHQQAIADLQGETKTVTLKNTQSYPFNNSQQSVALATERNHMENGIHDAHVAAAIFMQYQMHYVEAREKEVDERLDHHDAEFSAETGTVTLNNTNKVFFGFNNSGSTIALKTVRKTMNYDLDIEVVEVAGGQVGDVIVYDKQLNGFKLKFEGSAKTVKVKYKVRGGMYA